MDLRKWLLLQERPPHTDFSDLIRHVPCSEFRSPSVLALFRAGFRTGFRLTDGDGQPTEALHLMARLMGVGLCTADLLPPEEQRAFVTDDKGALITVLGPPAWYLRGLTDRIKSAWSMSSWMNQWVHYFLPGLDGTTITYKDPDGKRRRRVCYVARCRPDWRLSDDVYEGVFKWTYEHWGPGNSTGWAPTRWPDAYTLLWGPQTAGSAGDQIEGGGSSEALRAPAPTQLPASGVGTQDGPAAGAPAG